MAEVYCEWYEKPFVDVTYQEQSQCEENGQQCDGCPDLRIKENKREEQDGNRI